MAEQTMRIVLEVRPRWGQIAVVKAMTGVPPNTVRQLVNEHKVRCRKMDPEAANSATVYCVDDVCEWLDQEAPKGGPFRLPAGKAADAKGGDGDE